MNPDHGPGQIFVGRGIAQAPAGHGVDLGKPIHRNGTLPHTGKPTNTEVAVSRIDHLFVNFVRKNQKILFPSELSQFFKYFDSRNRTGWVIRGVNNNHSGLLRNPAPKVFYVRFELIFLSDWNRDGNRSRHLSAGEVMEPTGIRNENLVSGVEKS